MPQTDLAFPHFDFSRSFHLILVPSICSAVNRNWARYLLYVENISLCVISKSKRWRDKITV